jgi:hypothetical protein
MFFYIRRLLVKVNPEEFASLKNRFWSYLQAVPRELWFAGRRDAPSPAKQLYAVQKMFGINCVGLGGCANPEADPKTCFNYSRELKVAVSRLEQWERRMASKRRLAELARSIGR